MQYIGKILVFFGIAIVVIGIVLYFAGNKFSFLGHLPGDIRIERENFRFYFPITTMIIISLIINLVIFIIKKFL